MTLLRRAVIVGVALHCAGEAAAQLRMSEAEADRLRLPNMGQVDGTVTAPLLPPSLSQYGFPRWLDSFVTAQRVTLPSGEGYWRFRGSVSRDSPEAASLLRGFGLDVERCRFPSIRAGSSMSATGESGVLISAQCSMR